MAAYKPLIGHQPYEKMQGFVTSNPNNIDPLETENAVRETADFGNLPLVILSRGKSGKIKGFSRKENDSVNDAWATLQKDLSRLSSNSIQLTAEGAGHNIPNDKPRSIVSAVDQVLRLN